MKEAQKFTLTLPQPNSGTGEAKVECNGAVTVVGPNGAGKTKLGSWIEFGSPQRNLVHRITAQKSLTMPDVARPSALADAMKDLLYGNASWTDAHKANKYGNRPDTGHLNDFEKLMVYLFTEDYELTRAYAEKSAELKTWSEPPNTKLKMVKRIWEELLPHRKLKIGSSTIQTQPSDGGPIYRASEMSDGERVIFYLIGQALSVPSGGIMVVDEPELHLHKSIQNALWDKIEAERPDCLFVYLTHDLDFAASRLNSKKICLRGFNAKTGFDWFEVPTEEEIPEEIFLKIVGSRKPVLFIEGEKTSLDYFLFRHLFPEFTVVSRGSCDQVIQSTITFNATSKLHLVQAFGLLDRDQKSSEELDFLKSKHKVYSLDVSEVENLLLTEDALRSIAAVLKFTDATSIIVKAKEIVFSLLSKDMERVVSKLAAFSIESQLKKFDNKAVGDKALTEAVSKLAASIDVAKIFAEKHGAVEKILAASSYDEALKVYGNKGLLAQVAGSCFGMTRENFVALVKRTILKDDVKLIPALKKFVPAIT